MPTQPYFLDGVRVPSVTTILTGWGFGNGALLGWAFKQGQEGKRTLYEARDAAADVGTLAHAMVECHLRGVPFVAPLAATPAAVAGASQSYAAFCEWLEDTHLTVDPASIEVPLVSRELRCGGTPDWMPHRKNGDRACLDVKTGAGIYATNILQIAAYSAMWTETQGEALNGGAYLCRIDRDNGSFTTKWVPPEALKGPLEAFKHLRALYDLKKSIEALAK